MKGDREVALRFSSAPLPLAGQAPPAPAGDVEKGKTLYVKNGCASCHGLEGQGAPTSGPRIGPNPLPLEAFIKYIRAPKNQMPPYTQSDVRPGTHATSARFWRRARSRRARATPYAPRSNRRDLRLKPDQQLRTASRELR